MKIHFMISLMFVSIVFGDECNKEDWDIKAGLYKNKQLILITGEGRYHIQDFEFESGTISYKSRKETDLFLNYKEMVTIFEFDKYIIVINFEDVRHSYILSLYLLKSMLSWVESSDWLDIKCTPILHRMC